MPETLVKTPRGDIPISALRIGDLVETEAFGPQPIRWICRMALSAEMLLQVPQFRPVRVAPGALGNSDALFVSPQDRLVLQGDAIREASGQDECLCVARVAAEELDECFRLVLPRRGIEYMHLLLDRHSVLSYHDPFPRATIWGRSPCSRREGQRDQRSSGPSRL